MYHVGRQVVDRTSPIPLGQVPNAWRYPAQATREHKLVGMSGRWEGIQMGAKRCRLAGYLQKVPRGSDPRGWSWCGIGGGWGFYDPARAKGLSLARPQHLQKLCPRKYRPQGQGWGVMGMSWKVSNTRQRIPSCDVLPGGIPHRSNPHKSPAVTGLGGGRGWVGRHPTRA